MGIVVDKPGPRQSRIVPDEGAKSWYFVAADYAFGRAMVRDATAVINEKGGSVVGTGLACARNE